METVETHGNTVKKCIDPAAQQPSRLHLSCWERSGNPMPMRGNMPSSMRCHDSPGEHRRIVLNLPHAEHRRQLRGHMNHIAVISYTCDSV